MLVELYGIRDRQGMWSWYTTLDREMDRLGRQGLQEARVELIRFRPLLSMGQAEWLKRKLRERCSRSFRRTDLEKTLADACRQLGMVPGRILVRKETGMTFFGQTADIQLNKELTSTSSRAPLDKRVLDQMIRILAGRFLLPEELLSLMDDSGLGKWKGDWKRYVQAAVCSGDMELLPGLELQEGPWWLGTPIRMTCRRCGSGGAGLRWGHCADCGGPCPYCEKCLGMGKIRSCSLLISSPRRPGGERPSAGVGKLLDDWGLSPAQKEAAKQGLRFLRKDTGRGGNRFLIWAVTGAGKTEMIFPLVEHELYRGGRVLITTPRKDVVLELKPRLAKAFKERSVVALYGGSGERWEPGDITLSTTHQLLRFYRAFDLVIIDEIDAFPYYNNPMLEFAAQQVCAEQGRVVLLSATPPPLLQKEAGRGRLPHVRVPVRYHRYPLPVPEKVQTPVLERVISRGILPARLKRKLEASINRGAQLFIFVPKIGLVEPLVKVLRYIFPGISIEGTSSADEERTCKVADFRGKDIRMLVTTTILERGVTVPRTDVFILGADSRLFDEASLVQMAGRAGRSGDDPKGNVIFAFTEWTRSQARAIRQIRTMNRIAEKKGYLIEKGRSRIWSILPVNWSKR